MVIHVMTSSSHHVLLVMGEFFIKGFDSMKQVRIMGVPFAHTDRASFVKLLNEHIELQKKAFVVTANPEIVMKANEDLSYMRLLYEATYITADGIGIVKAAQLLGDPLPERVTGYDTMIDLLKLADQRGYSIYLLGAKEETLTLAIENIQKSYPNVRIVGSHHGYFDWENNQIANEIKALKPDMTFVALGMPRQEKWIAEHIDQFDRGVFMGVGGSFDVIAGTVKRAPDIWQKFHLEWLYRLLKQPSRFMRMMALPRFAIKILIQKLTGKDPSAKIVARLEQESMRDRLALETKSDSEHHRHAQDQVQSKTEASLQDESPMKKGDSPR